MVKGDPPMTNNERVLAYLDKCGFFFLATEDGDQPKCRPLGLKLEYNGRIYFGVGTFKEVYHQLLGNANVEICASDGEGFLRYYGEAIFDDDPAVAAAALELLPKLKTVYNERTGLKLGMFYILNGTAEFRNRAEIEDSLSL